MTTLFRLCLSFLVLVFCLVNLAAKEEKVTVYFGNYTKGDSGRIYASELDLTSGKLSQPKEAGPGERASFLVRHPSKNFLYAVCEHAGGGGANAYAIDPESETKLTLLNQISTGGSGPCHVSIDPTGKCLLIAHYGCGTVTAIPILEDGRIGEPASAIRHEGSSVHPKRQRSPHAHSFNVDPSNRFALAADLGTDNIHVYTMDPASAKLEPHDEVPLPPGSGPRHLAFHPDGTHVYVINELLNTISVFEYDPKRGKMELIQTIPTLPKTFREANTTAEVRVHPTGKFVYGSNRGHDSIAVFAVDPQSKKLTLVDHTDIEGETPRNFAIDPTGRFLLAAGQSSDSVAVFRIDPDSGRLTFTGNKVETPSPVCVVFGPMNEKESG